MHARLGRTAAALGLLASAAACDVALPAPTFTERDSAGVTIVESVRGAWEEGDGWSVGAEPTLQIGVVEGDPAHQFSSVVGVRRLDDGRIVVADRSTAQLRFFGPDGAFLSAVGGPGEGPGEFGQMTDVVPYRGDSILVWDSRARRVTVFDGEGGFGRVQTVAPADTEPQGTGSLRIVIGGGFTGAFADGSLVMRGNLRIAVESGVPFRVDVLPQRLTPEGEPRGVLGRFRGPYMSFALADSGERPTPTPFRGTLAEAVRGDRFYVGSGDAFEIEVRASDGTPERLIRAHHLDLTVTEAHRDAYLEELRASAEDPEELAELERVIPRIEFPETLPAYTGFLMDADGHLWVRHFAKPGPEGPPTWSVFDPEGRLLGQVETPAGFDVHQIGRDFLVGVWTDELDVPFVQTYALERR